MATFSTKSLHFPGGVPKKPKKPKILDSSGLAFAKTLKSLFFLVFWYLLRKWQRFPPKTCIFLEGYQKTKKTKDFGLFSPRLRQKKSKILDSSGLAFAKTLKSLVFCFVWHLLRKWQRFPPKACIFLEGTKKPKKTKDFGLFRPRLRQDSKIFVFLDFLVPPQEMATFPFLAILPAHYSML